MIANGPELQYPKRRAAMSAFRAHRRPHAARWAALGLLLALLAASRPAAIVEADDACQETVCELEAGQTEMFGTISTTGGQAGYHFNAVAGTALKATLVDLDADLDLHLYNPSDVDVQRSWQGGLEPEEIQFVLPEDGGYLLTVLSDPRYGDPQASYHLLVTITPPQPDEPVVPIVPTLNPVEDPSKEQKPPLPVSPTPLPGPASPTQVPPPSNPRALSACALFTDADAASLYEEPQLRGIVGGGSRATGPLGPYEWREPVNKTADETCFFIVPSGAYMSVSYFRNPSEKMFSKPAFPGLRVLDGLQDTAYVSACGFPALITRKDVVVVYGLREYYEQDGYSPTRTSPLNCDGFRTRVGTVLGHAVEHLISLGY